MRFKFHDLSCWAVGTILKIMSLKTAKKSNFTKKKFDLFDFTSFFAWTILNFLALYMLLSDFPTYKEF